MAFFACGTRDKLNARPAGATRHFVDGASLFGTGLIFSRCKALLVRVGLGRLSFEGRFWDMPENLPFATSRPAREVMAGALGTSLSVGLAGKSRCGEPAADMGRRDSASAWSAAAPRCVASLLAYCAGKRFAFPQLRTLAGSNPSACPQEKPPDRLCVREACFFGWDGGIRTPNSRHQKPEFYR